MEKTTHANVLLTGIQTRKISGKGVGLRFCSTKVKGNLGKTAGNRASMDLNLISEY